MKRNVFEQDLARNPANYAPLTPLSFIERAAYVYPNQVSVIHGARRYTWKETYARCRRLASEQGDDLPVEWMTRENAKPSPKASLI